MVARRAREIPPPRVRALYAREAHVIVHEELPGGGTVVGPGAMLFPILVAIGGMRADVEHGPVGDVPEQEIGILGHVRRLVQRRDLDEPLLIALPGDVPQLPRIAAAERDLAAAVQHLAADIEILIDDEHGETGIACPDRARQSGTPGTDDDKIHLVVPLDAVGARPLRGRRGGAGAERCGADTGRHASLDEISPAD